MQGLASTIALAALAFSLPQSARAHDFTETGLRDIQDMMETAVRDGRIQGAIAMLAQDDRIAWLGTAGEMGPGVPMRRDAIIPLASVGKMYTATAVMILVERGAIALDDPVSRFVPEFAKLSPDRPVTVRHLLTHTGGLKVDGDDFWALWYAHTEHTTTTAFARALAGLPMQSGPGTRFQYGPTGASYEVLGAIVEIASHETLETFMTKNIFEPLGLADTYFYLPDEKAARLPAFERRVDGSLKPSRPYGRESPRTTYFFGGGGVESTADDILRFARLFLHDGTVDGVRVLKPETVRMMMSNQIGDLPAMRNGLRWGFGAAVRQADDGTVERYGWVGGGYAKLWVDRSRGLVAYIAFPLEPPGDNDLLDEFERRVDAALAVPATRP